MGSFYEQFNSRFFIRLSDNPIIAKGFEEMMNSGDVVQEKPEITKMHRFEFLNDNVAMFIFTLGSKFSYKVTLNNDLPTIISIFKKVDSILKFH